MGEQSTYPRTRSQLNRQGCSIHNFLDTTFTPFSWTTNPQNTHVGSYAYPNQLDPFQVDFQQLQEVTQELLEVPDTDSAAEVALAGIKEVLGYSLAAIWLVDDSNSRLEPIAVTDKAAAMIDTQPVYTATEESLSWQAFANHTSRRIDSLDSHPECYNSDTSIESELIIPIGEFGILNIGSTEPAAFSDKDLRRVEAWIETVESVMSRLERIDQLEERKDALQRERERLADFAGMIAHDLQNPLNIAKGYLTQVQTICDCEELEKIESAVDRMETIIDDTLTLAKQGDTVDQCETVSIPRLIESCVTVTDIDDDAIEVVDTFEIKADPNRLAHVFENLCQNAVDHGGSDVSVRIGQTTDGFYVADDGPGISPEEQSDIFDTGYTTSREGTGLGLRIVTKIVEAHGWSIEVSTSDSGGARFDITGVRFVDH